MSEHTDWLTVAEAAAILRMTIPALRRPIQRGEVPSYRLGKKRIRLRRDELDRMLKPRERPADADRERK